MNRTINPSGFHHRLHLYILKRLLILANIIGLSAYILLRIIFYDLPFVMEEELLIALKIMGYATGTAVAISFILFAGDGLRYLLRHRKPLRLPMVVRIPEPSHNNNNAA